MEEESIPTQVLQRLGVADRACAELHSILRSEGYNTPSPGCTNALERGGQVVGYLVTDDEGEAIVVDENGVPVSEEDATRTPIPPFVDEDGNPRWSY